MLDLRKPFSQDGHVLADFLVGDAGVDLGSADIGVTEDAAEGFDRHAPVESQGGEGVAAHMEGQVRAEAAAAPQRVTIHQFPSKSFCRFPSRQVPRR